MPGSLCKADGQQGEALGRTLLLTLTARHTKCPASSDLTPSHLRPKGRHPEAPVHAKAPACLESLVQPVQTADREMGPERRRHFFQNLQGVHTETCSVNKVSDTSSRADLSLPLPRGTQPFSSRRCSVQLCPSWSHHLFTTPRPQ